MTEEVGLPPHEPTYAERTIFPFALSVTGTSQFVRRVNYPIVIPERSDIVMRVLDVTDSATQVSASMDILLLNDIIA